MTFGRAVPDVEQASSTSASANWLDAADATHIFPRRSYAIYIVIVLLLVTLSSYLDRQLPALLVKPIKQAFTITDTQFSLLQGPAFAIFYTIMGLPFGRLVDQKNRRNLILLGLLLWSTMTVLAGLASNYWAFFATRVGIGVGEACLAPAAYSIIADCFPPLERARAISGYYIALALGAGASMLIGSSILPHLPADGVTIALLGTIPPWKLLFIIVGLPGLLLAPLLLTVREPIRREAAGLKSVEARGTYGEFLGYVRRHGASFFCVITSASAIATIGYANMGWAPSFYDRHFGIPVSSSGPIIGIMLACAGFIGTLVSGFLSDRWTKQGKRGTRFRVMAFAWLLILPTAIAWPLMPIPFASYAIFGIELIAFNIGLAAGPVVIQDIVPNRMRGQAITGYLLIAGLCGIGFGPMAVALLTDHVFHNDQALGPALSLIAIGAGMIGISVSWAGLSAYTKSWRATAGLKPGVIEP